MSTTSNRRLVNLRISIIIEGDSHQANVIDSTTNLADLKHLFDVIEEYHAELVSAISKGRYTLLEEEKAEETPVRIKPKQYFNGQL
jgi:hypothetical protein